MESEQKLISLSPRDVRGNLLAFLSDSGGSLIELYDRTKRLPMAKGDCFFDRGFRHDRMLHKYRLHWR